MSGAKKIDLISLLSTKKRDLLIRTNGDNVDVKDLKRKQVVGIYFSWCPPCQDFNPVITKVYQQLSNDSEIVFVPFSGNRESFKGYFSKMNWLAIPVLDSSVDLLIQEFDIQRFPCLVLVDGAGNVLSTQGVELVREYRGDAFKPERISQLKEEEELARANQTIESLLVYGSRDYVISNVQNKIRISELEGKMVALYFSTNVDLTEELVEVYHKLKAKGENFEIVMISLDDDEEEFNEEFGAMPWLSLPFQDKACKKLTNYFEFSSLPRLVIIGHDGRTLNNDATELVIEYGAEAYPFTPERVAELEEMVKTESLFVPREEDYLLTEDTEQEEGEYLRPSPHDL